MHTILGLLLEILVLMLLSLEILLLMLLLQLGLVVLELRLVVVLLLMLLSLEVLLLLGHHCQPDVGRGRKAVGHGERVVRFEGIVGLSKAAVVGHAGDLLPPRPVFVEAVE